MTRRILSITLFAGLGLAATLALAGCGGNDEHEGEHGHEGQHEHEGQQEHGTQTQAGQADTYPLDTCVVTGEKLGSMGDPVVIQHEGRTVKLCCQGCVATFKADPDPYLAKLDAAAGGQGGHSGEGHEGHQHD